MEYRSRRDFSGRNNTRGGGKSYGGGGSFGRKTEMFSAVCDKCGKNCEVPFRPSNNKPIYCSDCFRSVDPRNDNRDFRESPRRENFSSNSNRSNEKATNYTSELSQLNDKLNSICIKLDKILNALDPKIIDLTEEKTSKEEETKKVKSVRKASTKKNFAKSV